MRFFPRVAENVRLHDRQASHMSAFSNRCLLTGSRRDVSEVPWAVMFAERWSWNIMAVIVGLNLV
jgi:hypothetical protein